MPASDSTVTQAHFYAPEEVSSSWDTQQESGAVPLIKRNLCQSLQLVHPISSCHCSPSGRSALQLPLEKGRANSALCSKRLITNVLFVSVEKEFNYACDTETSHTAVSNAGICKYFTYSISMGVPGLVLVLISVVDRNGINFSNALLVFNRSIKVKKNNHYVMSSLKTFSILSSFSLQIL